MKDETMKTRLRKLEAQSPAFKFRVVAAIPPREGTTWKPQTDEEQTAALEKLKDELAPGDSLFSVGGGCYRRTAAGKLLTLRPPWSLKPPEDDGGGDECDSASVTAKG